VEASETSAILLCIWKRNLSTHRFVGFDAMCRVAHSAPWHWKAFSCSAATFCERCTDNSPCCRWEQLLVYQGLSMTVSRMDGQALSMAAKRMGSGMVEQCMYTATANCKARCNPSNLHTTSVGMQPSGRVWHELQSPEKYMT
jgi:hypothetical protein